MRRPTDKQLFDMIEERVGDGSTGADLIVYAQLRALERIADNLHGVMEVLAVIRADHKTEAKP